jgi:uncharacterized membrane protein
MDDTVVLLNSLFCALLAALLGWAVLSRGTQDGLIIKVGLVLMSLGFLAVSCLLLQRQTMDAFQPILRAGVLIHAGLVVVVVGWALRVRTGHSKLRRYADWVNLHGRMYGKR